MNSGELVYFQQECSRVPGEGNLEADDLGVLAIIEPRWLLADAKRARGHASVLWSSNAQQPERLFTFGELCLVHS